MPSKKIIAALDIETTGLSADRDAVIEVGLVRYRGDREEERWSSFVNPGRPIPALITQLTGINDAMVSGAPRLRELLPKISELTQGAAILGHNIAFDISFFRSFSLLADLETIDTLEFASALLPRAPRYNLGALCAYLEIPLSATHRALDDALAAHALYRSLVEIARGLPIGSLAELVRFGQNVEWGGGNALEDLYSQRLKEEGAIAKTPGVRFPVFEPAPRPAPRSEPAALQAPAEGKEGA
jgi:DNA polymerase III epsilon subunit family exonuclease